MKKLPIVTDKVSQKPMLEFERSDFVFWALSTLGLITTLFLLFGIQLIAKEYTIYHGERCELINFNNCGVTLNCPKSGTIYCLHDVQKE